MPEQFASYEQLPGDTIFKTVHRHLNRQLLKPGNIYDFQYSCTWKCHSRCNHCFIWKKKPTYELTVDELDRYLQPRKLFSKCTNVVLTGGDPFERKDLREVLSFFSELLPKASISTPTNSFWCDRVIEIARWCKEHNINHITSLSLDGFADTHNLSRGRPLFDKVLKIIDNLTTEKLSLDINITLYKFNLHEFQFLAHFLLKKGIYVRISLPGINWYFNNEGCDYSEVYTHPYVTEFFDKLQHMPFYDKNHIPRCFHGFHTFYMDPLGIIYPCQGLPYHMGRLGQPSTFGTIWNSQKAKEVRKQVLQCKGCHTTVERCMNIRYDGTRSKIARLQRRFRGN